MFQAVVMAADVCDAFQRSRSLTGKESTGPVAVSVGGMPETEFDWIGSDSLGLAQMGDTGE